MSCPPRGHTPSGAVRVEVTRQTSLVTRMCRRALSGTPSNGWSAWRKGGCSECLQRHCVALGSRLGTPHLWGGRHAVPHLGWSGGDGPRLSCLLYTSDAADE